MTDTRTATSVAKLVEDVQADIGDIVERLESGLALARKLEAHAGGINGLRGTLKAEASKLDQILTTLREESESVAKKMLASERPPMATKVNHEHAAKVVAAKAEEVAA